MLEQMWENITSLKCCFEGSKREKSTGEKRREEERREWNRSGEERREVYLCRHTNQ
jgi:hypothetical protein